MAQQSMRQFKNTNVHHQHTFHFKDNVTNIQKQQILQNVCSVLSAILKVEEGLFYPGLFFNLTMTHH